MKTETALLESGKTRRAEGRFYIGMALVAMAIAVAGFVPALVDGERKEPLTWAVGAHGVVFGAWLLLFLTQTILVPKGRIAVHRRLGYVGLGLAVLLVVSGYFTAIAMARRGYDLSGDIMNTSPDALFALLFQLSDLVTFGFLVGVAVWYRRLPDVHKRLMLLAIVGALTPAALTHIWGHSPVLREIKAPIILIPLIPLLFAGAVHDRLSRGRIHPVSLWVALVLLVWTPLRAVVIGPSETWHQFAAWLIR